MVLLGSTFFDASTLPVLQEKKAARLHFWLLLVVVITLGGTTFHYAFAIPGLILPVFFLRRTDARFILSISGILIFKALTSLITEPGEDYARYAMDYGAMAREIVTIFLFFAWMLMGQRILDARKIEALGWKTCALMITILYGFCATYFKRIFIGDAGNLVFMLLFLYYIILIGPYSGIIRFLAVMGMILTGLIPRDSSFAVLACGMLILLYMLSTRLSRKIIPWRIIAVTAIIFMMTMSLFAYLVNVRPMRENGEGNNGYTRATLAEAGYHQFIKEPVFGSQLGRGILPIPVIEKLGWSQYFTDTSQYNIFALSFHNSFIYLLTRFGLLSFILFGMLLGRIPKQAPAHVVLFTCILILGAGANVIIESLASGPSMGFVLGALIPLGTPASRHEYIRTKEKVAVPT